MSRGSLTQFIQSVFANWLKFVINYVKIKGATNWCLGGGVFKTMLSEHKIHNSFFLSFILTENSISFINNTYYEYCTNWQFGLVLTTADPLFYKMKKIPVLIESFKESWYLKITLPLNSPFLIFAEHFSARSLSHPACRFLRKLRMSKIAWRSMFTKLYHARAYDFVNCNFNSVTILYGRGFPKFAASVYR